MINFVVDQSSVEQSLEYLEAVRQRIFAQVRLGMKEAMDGLGQTAIAEMAAAGIVSRTGKLAEGFEFSSVRENRNVIVGQLWGRRDMTIKGRTFAGYVGTALDEGYRVPEVKDTLIRFTKAGEGTFYSRGHVAFDVEPHPFLRQASEAFAPTLIEIIAERIAAATEPQ